MDVVIKFNEEGTGMSEGNYTNEAIFFLPEKQKELYDIISDVFSEELKTSNCFILPAVGQRAGAAMRDKGFEKANKATFLAAPEYFVLGYNEKNVDAISLIGYPADANFSIFPNVDYVPTLKQGSIVLTHEQQKELAEIFVNVFKDYNKNGKVYLASVGLRAGKRITEAGLGRVSIELFKGASDYFAYAQDEKGSYLVYLKDDCDVSMPNKSLKPKANKNTTERKSQKKEKKQFEDMLFEQLKKNYKTNDVSIGNILTFLRNSKIVLPENIPSYDMLINLLSQKYGSVIRDNGEGTSKEKYIILRKTLPIPQNICERVELIIAEFFLNQDLIPNGDIGQALRSNGIDFKEYNYADLTAFIREFPQIFKIVAQPTSNNRFQIFVRILPSFKERYAGVEFKNDNQEQILQSQFEKVVCEMFAEGKYESIVEQSILREAIKHSNGEMWNCIIKSYYIVSGMHVDAVCELNEWEKISFDFEFLCANATDEFLSKFAFSKEDVNRIKQYVLDYSHKTVNYSTLGQRIQFLCGKDSYLADAILNLGLVARITGDKAFCFRLLMLYYGRNNEEKMRDLWLKHAAGCINPSSMIMIVGTWFTEGKFDYIIEMTGRYNEINAKSEVVQLYYTYAGIIHGNIVREFPDLSIIENRRSIELVGAFLEYAKRHSCTELYVKMIFSCVITPNQYVSISTLENILLSHSDFLKEQYSYLVHKAEARDRESLIVLRQLISLGVISPDNSWETINDAIRDDYRCKIAECSPENKEAILYEAIDYFPTESVFVDELVSVIKRNGSSDDGENLEGFIDNLIDSGNYEQVIMLYEHDTTLDIRDKIWFLRKLSYCYQKRQEPKKLLDTEMAIISSILDEGEDINECLTQLIGILYEGFISRSLISLDEVTATKLSQLYNHYKCETKDAHKYCIAMMGLALCTKNIPMLSLLYCLSEGISDEKDFVEICEDEIQESSLGYSYRVGDLQKTFEYLVTQEKPEVFFMILGRAANVIRTKQDETIYNKLRDSSVHKIDPNEVITLIIAEYNRERSWKLLSQFSNKLKKYTVNFIANNVWFFKFKDTTYPLTNCVRALEWTLDDSLPRNFLWCSLSVWNTDFGRPIGDYQKSFIEHITKCKSFQDAGHEIITAYYNMLLSQKRPGQNEILLATEIAKQTNSFGEFYNLFIKTDGAYKSLVKANLGSFVCFCSAFVYCADDESYITAFLTIKELRNQISSSNISRNDRSALMWIDDLLARRSEFAADDYFVEASMAVLSSYPEAPSNEIVSKWITPESTRRLPNYVLIRNWINTFGNIRTVGVADSAIRNYLSRNWLPEDGEERANLFKIRFFLAEKYIVYFNRAYPNTNDDYLRRCKTYYGLRKLAKIETPIPVDFKDKMYKDLEYAKKLDAYLNFEAGVDRFADSVENEYIREMFLYCGITNYWDVFLDKCLLECDEIVSHIDAIENYFKVIDYRPVRRRLLQMYVYSSAAQIMLDNENIDLGSLSDIKDVRYFHNRISNGNIELEEYHSKLTRLVDILQPSLLEIIKRLEEVDSDDNRLKLIQGVIFALTNKDLKIFRVKLDTVDDELLETIVLPTVIAIQQGRDLSEMLLQMVLNGEADAVRLLSNKSLNAAVGSYENNLFMSILCVKTGDFEQAAEYLSRAGSRGITYGLLYDKLQEAISTKKDIDIAEDLGVSIQIHERLPKFSFMKTSDPYGVGLHQLISDFYSDNLYDEKGKCLVASRILSLIEDGGAYSDSIKFLFDWGFTELEATYDIEKKANILFEMLESLDKLNDIKAFKERFVRYFLYLLQEFDFTILIKNFKRIFNCYKTLYTKFSPYDNCDCYAQALILLRDLYKLGKENIDPNATMCEIDNIKSRILDLHIKYPQNRFANKCIDYVDRFIQQIFERGVFEVRILNVDKQFDGVIYYQIRNIGFEIISDIALTFAIEGVPNTINQVRISSIIPEGLRPNQVYAGEYSLSADFDNDIEIGCSITVEYTSLDDEGREVYKNYVAVDPNTDGKLIVVQNCVGVYQKDGGAGYIEEPIKRKSDFIGRKNELNRIMGKILKGQNVLLFGTNGTGKSSILHNIRQVCLPAAYNDENQQLGKYYAAELKFDIDCTERNVLESIVNAVSGETRFRVFIKQNGTEETKDILALAAEEWASNVEKMFDIDGSCINTDAVRQYFVTLDEAFALSDLDLYILIDQFERVISSKNIASKHMLFLRDLTCQKIRFIMAGSNYLLEEVSVDKINNQQDNFWSDIFSRGFEKVKIGNMDQEDFELLITQKNALNNGEMKYTPEALAYLWQFTKGHAFYSCLLGNRTLDIMSSRKVKRNVIYPSDLFIAIYQPGKYLPGEKSNKEKETAIKDQIFQDIIDNNPIKYVGKTLARMQSSGESKVSYQKLRDYIEEHRPDILEDFADALSVLVARDFITYDEIDIQRESNFLHQTENLRAAREYFFTSDLYLEHFATVYVPELSDKDREAIESKNRSIEALESELRSRTYEEIEELRNRLPTMFKSGETRVIHTDKYVEGDDKSSVVQVNIQNMTNAFNQIMAGAASEQLLASIQSLPRLGSYLPQISETSENIELSDERISLAMDSYVSDMEESIEASCKQNGKKMPECWNILKFKSEDDFESFKREYGVPQCFFDSLQFAYQLEILFEEGSLGENANQIDYSPVTIMYCKLVESLLKEYHIVAYSDSLSSVETELNYKKNGKKCRYRWGDIKKLSQYQKQKLTIGSFVFPIVNDNDHRDHIVDLATNTPGKSVEWETHAEFIKEVRDIRNPSAHGNKNHKITHEQMLNIKNGLIDKGGLRRMITIVKEPI